MDATKVDVQSSESSAANKLTMLSMAKIKLDSGLQVRVSLSAETIAAYAKEMKEGAQFPPVDVFHDGSEYWLANGFHRYNATKTIGVEEIAVLVHSGSRRDAMLFAISKDAIVGLRRSNDDKNKAVGLLLGDKEWKEWSDGKLAKLAGVSDRFVAKLRKQTTPNGSEKTSTKYDKDGETRSMKLPKKQRAEKLESGSNSQSSEATVREVVLASSSESSSESKTKDIRSDEVDGKLLMDIKEVMVKGLSRRKMSDLEMLAIDFSDALDAILSEEEVPSGNEISTVADVEVLVKRFLEKFSKDEE